MLACTLFEVILPRLSGAISGMSTPEKLSSSLLVLTCVMDGMKMSDLSDASSAVCSTLASASILDCNDRDVMDALFVCTQAFVTACEGSGLLQSNDEG